MSKPVTADLFTFYGRRNRKSYILAILLWALLFFVIWGIAGTLSYASNGMAPMIIAGLLAIPFAVSGLALGGQRCRDFGWTGWAILITLIPYIGALFAIAIMFVPGNQGTNRYGPDPLAFG